MLEFVLLVVLANLFMMLFLYFLRRVLAIRTPVILMAVGISIFLCILYPLLVALVSYPQVIYLYAGLILAGAAVLYAVENRLFSAGELPQGNFAGPALGDVLAAVEGPPPAGVGRDAFPAPGDAGPVKAGENIVEPGMTDAGPAQISVGEECAAGLEAGEAYMYAPEAALEQQVDPGAGESNPEEFAAGVPAAAQDKIPDDSDFADTAAGLPAGDMPAPDGDEDAGDDPAEAGEAIYEAAPAPEAPPGIAAGEDSYAGPPAGGYPETVPGRPGDELPLLPGKPEPGEAAAGLDDAAPPSGTQDIERLVTRAFDALGSGNKSGAAESFFKALQLNPDPRLAVMLSIELSSIYLSEGRKGQALAVMEMLRDVWGPLLDEKDFARMRTIIIQLRREVQ